MHTYLRGMYLGQLSQVETEAGRLQVAVLGKSRANVSKIPLRLIQVLSWSTGFVGPRRGRYPIGCAKEREAASIERGNTAQKRRTDPPRGELEKDGLERGRCRYRA